MLYADIPDLTARRLELRYRDMPQDVLDGYLKSRYLTATLTAEAVPSLEKSFPHLFAMRDVDLLKTWVGKPRPTPIRCSRRIFITDGLGKVQDVLLMADEDEDGVQDYNFFCRMWSHLPWRAWQEKRGKSDEPNPTVIFDETSVVCWSGYTPLGCLNDCMMWGGSLSLSPQKIYDSAVKAGCF